MKRIAQIENSYRNDIHPEFRSGDSVKVHVKIKEGDKERIQVFQGTVISRRGGGTGATFTVRKISAGIGVERIFPLHSPNIAKIERSRMGKVRRAKLYYLRELTGKSARIEERLDEKSLNKLKAEKAVRKTKKSEKKAEEVTEAVEAKVEETAVEAKEAKEVKAEAKEAKEAKTEAKEEKKDK